ncbi:MAG: tetratricopeptide repeat protein [Nannocystaceae bacterium]|nr:tetratricopeptide repeat protein [Nannocystaceae bacterium]
MDGIETTVGLGPADTLPAAADLRATAAEPAVESTVTMPRGAELGRYVVLRELGRGGMGVVYAAFDPELDRRVAIKVLHADDPGGELEARNRRLVREAQTLARLSHGNVITVHDVGTWRNRVFIAMESLDGGTLRQWLGAAPRPWPEIVAKLTAAGRGLQAAHDVGLVHRDFKPENVLLGAGDRVVVADFGLARAAADARVDLERTVDDGVPAPRSLIHAPLTMTGAVLGTPAYMAPEQHLGREPDRRTDQFAFAVVAWEALYGQRPFAGDNLAQLSCNVTAGAITVPDDRRGVPRFVHTALLRALSVEPDARFPEISALLSELSRPATPRWRRPLLVASVGSGVIAVTATMVLAREGRCDGGPAQLEPAWNETRAAALRQAFAATAAPFADATAEVVVQSLDDYARAWLAQHREACEATAMRAEQSEAALDLRMHCLRRRARDLDAVVGVLLDADVEIVRTAIDATRRLPELGACADTESLASAIPPPSSAGDRAALGELEDGLARADALRLAGKYDAAKIQVESLRQAAAALARPDVDAELALSLARSLERLGQGEAALLQAKQAVWSAVQARRDALALEAIATVIGVLGPRLHRPDETADWIALGQATLSRLGSPAALESQLQEQIGAVRYEAGDYLGALEARERAIALRRADTDADDPLLVALQAQRGSTLLALGRHAEAIATLREALQLRLQRFGPDHPVTGTAMLHLGNALFEDGQRDAAIAQYEQALAVLNRALGPDHADVGLVHVNLGNALAESGGTMAARAMPHYQRAIEIWSANGGRDDLRVGIALGNLGRLQLYAGEPREAVAALERAIEIQSRHRGPDHSDLVYPLLSHSEALRMLGQANLAEPVAARALAIARDELPDPHPLVARARFELARTLLDRAATTAAPERTPLLERAVAELEAALTTARAASARDGEIGLIAAALARALVEARPGAVADRTRARALATEAIERFSDDPHERRSVQDWLAAQDGSDIVKP